MQVLVVTRQASNLENGVQLPGVLPVPSSNGQDARFSTWRRGFDSCRDHNRIVVITDLARSFNGQDARLSIVRSGFDSPSGRWTVAKWSRHPPDTRGSWVQLPPVLPASSTFYQPVAQFGSVPGLGPGGRRFESYLADA